jgi:hypothetical protein
MDTNSVTEFEYRGWYVHAEPRDSVQGCALCADLYYRGKYQCRVALTPDLVDPSCAYWALDSKVRDFIDDQISRSIPSHPPVR